MTQKNRLSDRGRIDRSRPLRFVFNGREMEGFAGDTVASALLANGARVVGRSFKYHRPRGIMAAGAEEPSAILTAGEGARRTPNVRAAIAPLRDGMVVRSQGGWPSVENGCRRAAVRRRTDAAAGVLLQNFYVAAKVVDVL